MSKHPGEQREAIPSPGVILPGARARRGLTQVALLLSLLALLVGSPAAQGQGRRQLHRWRDGKNVSYQESRRTERYIAYLQKKSQQKARREQRAGQALRRRQHQATRSRSQPSTRTK